jgi:prevent-host-death family protein
MSRWQLQEAKARFSQLVKSARLEGPQEITVHGKSTAVLLSAEDYQRLTGPKLSFIEFMRRSPLVGVDLDVRRSTSTTRRVRL